MKTQKNQKKRTFRFNIYLFFVLVFMVFVSIDCIDKYQTYTKLCEEKSTLEKKIKEEEEKTLVLKSEMDMVKSDSYIEETARERLGYVKENQIIFIDSSK